MTAVVCWERKVAPLTELVFASDSRTTGGEFWDACPKLFNIGRSDVVMAFAGNTFRAYPFTLQALATVASYRASERRSLDVSQLASHLQRAMDVMLEMVKGQTVQGEPPGCEFLIGGWSWRLSKFRTYKIVFEPVKGGFMTIPMKQAPPALGGLRAAAVYATIGDGGSEVTRRLARARQGSDIPLDLEPLDALSAVCRDNAVRTVGGPLQVMKAYRSLSSECFAIEQEGVVTISGRRTLGDENHDLRVLKEEDGSWRIAKS